MEETPLSEEAQEVAEKELKKLLRDKEDAFMSRELEIGRAHV